LLAGSQYREQAQDEKNFLGKKIYDALAEIARSVNTLIADTKDSLITVPAHIGLRVCQTAKDSLWGPFRTFW